MAFLDGLGKALKALDCFVLGQSEYIFGSANALQGLDQGTVAAVIGGYRRLRGCDPENDPSPGDPSVTGGQCANTPYALTWETRVGDSVNGFSWVAQADGNFTGPVSVNAGPSNGGEGCPEGLSLVEYVVTGAGGSRPTTLVSGCVDVTPGYRNLIATPAFGGPNDCGDGGPLPVPPTNINIDVDVAFNDEGDNPVNITIPVTFKPFTVNFNGDVNFPIEFSFGGVDFNGDVSFAPDFNLTVNGPRFPKGGGGSMFPTGDPADDRPPAAPEANIVGAIVVAQSVSDNAATSVNFSNGPDIFAPRLGSLKFAYSLGAATFWSADIDVKGERVFIPCPFSQGADAIAVSPVPGVSLTATPVKGFPLATIGDIKVVLDSI